MDYIAVDIGASSGRLIHANFQDLGGFELNEIHRFKNGFKNVKGTNQWDLYNLVSEILKGLEKVKKRGIKECFVGIDTWAVDYGLVDAEGKILGNPVSYRDNRTKNAIADFDKKMSLNELSDKVGITLANLSILKNNKAKAIRLSTLDAICKALDCEVADILEYREGDGDAEDE